MSSPSDDDPIPGVPDLDAPPSTQAPVKLETCVNCGRTFNGEYCPACGQQADSELSIIGILGGFARELVDTEQGLWQTFKDLTLRPGTTVRAYLAGTRKPLTSPGRYLLVGAIVATGISMILQGVGASPWNPGLLATNVAQGFAEGTETSWEGTAWNAGVRSLQEFGAVPALVLLVLAGLAGVLYRSLFRKAANSPAEALAVAAYATAHATILFQGVHFAFELVEHYGGLGTRLSTVFEWISNATLLLYPGFVTYGCFGASVWNGIKGVLGWTWAYVEVCLVAIIGLSGYAEWLLWAHPDAYPGEGPAAMVAIGFGVFLLLVHGVLELYGWYRKR